MCFVFSMGHVSPLAIVYRLSSCLIKKNIVYWIKKEILYIVGAKVVMYLHTKQKRNRKLPFFRSFYILFHFTFVYIVLFQILVLLYFFAYSHTLFRAPFLLIWTYEPIIERQIFFFHVFNWIIVLHRFYHVGK